MPVAKLSTSIEKLGWGNGLLYAFGRALQRASGGRARLIRYVLVAQPVPPAAQAQCRPSAKNPVRAVLSDDPLVQQFPRAKSVVTRRFRTGSTCFATESKGGFSGFLWLARDAYEEDEVRCRYELAQPDCSAWDFDVYVEPEYRIGRTFARLWDAANSHLDGQGVRWSFSRISTFNPASLSSHSRLGVRKLYTATFLCLGKLQVAVIGAPPFVHFSLSPASRPVLRLHPPADG
ncbi:GNAT family N-acetyltransferase [Aromatoleum buckelii]|uniref:GNAT family N-acetyltransferase n=1 Tax=Aromatoleum buckelii TaxID=200254 RepID=A0ABX1N3H0_9RHOO|nr:GNAT family N-acetyltransferase [Aromatoleum buckelii]MCK0510763.1 GNAT family N-acetyltransferase [Aromatoleum buckelii]